MHRHHLVGIGDGATGRPRRRFLELVDHVHALHHFPDNRVLAVQTGPSANMMKNCEFALSTLSPRRAMPTMPRLKCTLGEFLLQVRIFRPAAAVEILAVAGLRHEAVHDAMERHVVVIAVARKLLDTLGVLGRDIGPQLDDDAALGGVDDDRIGLVEIGRQRLGDRRRDANQRGDEGKNSDHENPGMIEGR